MSLKNNTQKRRRGLLNYLRKNTTKKYLKRCSKEHLKNHEQLVVFSFDYISRMIALEGQYETNEIALIKNTFAFFLQDKTILDVGANIGNHTVAFSKMAKNVIAFEPNPLVFELLKINTKNLKNVRIFNFGASDKDAEYEAEVPPSNCGGGHILINSEDRKSNSLDSKIIFQLRKIDNLEEIVNRDIGLVKVDVEGHEINVFRGMRNLLNKQKPPVLFEQ